jgi:photoactive yellow protein
MEKFEYTGVDLSELLPRIPDNIQNDLPFGLVKMDTDGNILQYNMAEGEIAGVDPQWAIGKNFFDEVAVCTKTAAFYGRFVEGVKKGFLNTMFDYTFDHRSNNARVRVHMAMMPDHLGKKTVMLLVKRVDKPLVMDAFSPAPHTMPSPTQAAPAGAADPIQQLVQAVIAALNAGSLNVPQAMSAPAPQAAAPAPRRAGHADILQL